MAKGGPKMKGMMMAKKIDDGERGEREMIKNKEGDWEERLNVR